MAHDLQLMKNLLALKKRSMDVKFELSETPYTSLENIGSGAYGVVCCARHEPTGDRVAIKKIPNIFDLTMTAKRTYREMKILRHFKHDNIISISEILQVKDAKTYKDVYVVLDLMESDLHRIIHSNQPLTEEHVRYFIYQIFRGLKYIHSANIIHRDLKPSNILVNENCLLKIGDFGMARCLNESGADLHQHKQCMTQYVATRWYRAPELIMLFDDYSEAVDLWSTGCILAEMLGRKQIFPAKDVLSQLQMIITTLGAPPDYLLHRSQSDIVRGLVRSVKVGDIIPLNIRYPRASRKAIDLLNGLLVLDPNKRLTAKQALKHLFVNKYHDPNDEPTCEKFDFSFEYQAMNCEQLRCAIYAEIQSFHKTSDQSEQVLDSKEIGQSVQPLQFLVNPDNSFKVPNRLGGKNVLPAQSSVLVHDVEMLSARSNTDTEMLSANPQTVNQPQVLLVHSGLNQAIGAAANQNLQPVTVHNSDIPNAVIRPGDIVHPSGDIRPTSDIHPTQDLIPSGETSVKSRPDLTISTAKSTNKTISEDTKALIKAALLQSTNRRRMSESGENQAKKPVTAQQRQKEREERRRKKSEKSKRKSKEKVEPELSQEDKTMLERWQNMAPPKKESALQVPPTNQAPPTNICVSDVNVSQPAVLASLVGPSPPQVLAQSDTIPLVLDPTMSFLNRSAQPQPVTLITTQQVTAVPLTDATPSLSFLSAAQNATAQQQQHQERQQHLLFQQNQQQQSLQNHQHLLHGQQILANQYQAQEKQLQQLLQIQKQQEQQSGQHHTSPQQSLPQLQFISNPTGIHDTLQFISPPKSHSSPTLSFVNAMPKSSWTEATLQASPATQQSFIQTHSLLAQLNQIAKPDPKNPTTCPRETERQGNRDPLLGQCSKILTRRPASQDDSSMQSNDSVPVICIDSESDSSNDAITSQSESPESRSRDQDSLADMTKQFSKSQVDDLLPPNLVSTPKGGVEGDGVGLDLDEILHEWIASNKGSDVTPESAPLSASTLTDWLQVAGNVDPRDMADLQRELDLSPMVTAD